MMNGIVRGVMMVEEKLKGNIRNIRNIRNIYK